MNENNQFKNEPTLFINTVSDKRSGNENQLFFDSRAKKEEEKKKIENKKKIINHRLDDIKAMLMHNIDISCDILSNNCNYKGIASRLSDGYLIIKMDEKIVNIPIDNIDDIKIY